MNLDFKLNAWLGFTIGLVVAGVSNLDLSTGIICSIGFLLSLYIIDKLFFSRRFAKNTLGEEK